MAKWNIAVLAITGYQQYLSPYKGFCCAHRMVTGDDSCSTFAKQAIIEVGFWSAIKMIRHRFAACKKSALYLKRKKKERKEQVQLP